MSFDGRGHIVRAGVIAVCLITAAMMLGACQPSDVVLRGTVTTTSGTQVAGIKVDVYANFTKAFLVESTTDASGTFSFSSSDLPDGTYRLYIQGAGWWNGASSWDSATPVAVSLSAPAVINATSAISTGSVAGTVTDTNGPVGDVAVSAVNKELGTTISKTTTAADGTYDFAGLPPANYVFEFSKAGLTTRFNSGVSFSADAPAVSVTAGSSTTGVDVALSPEATITGTVTDGSDPLSGVTVIAYDPSSAEAIGLALSAPDGTFTLGRLDTASYTIGISLGAEQRRALVYGSSSLDPTTGTPLTPTGGTFDIGTVVLGDATPAPPASGDAFPGDARATVNWTASPDDGGAPITAYTVTASSGQSCSTTGALSCEVTGLTNGQVTSFKITATNAVGTSTFMSSQPTITPEPADFCSQDHTGADFPYAVFNNADLTGCNFTNANLSHSYVRNAKLAGATLTGAKTVQITGTPASLPTGWQAVNGSLVGPGADLEGASLNAVDLTGASLAGANLHGVDLTGSRLANADLAGATLTTTTMKTTDLSGTNLSGADFTGAVLTQANLTDAELTDAVLSGVSTGGLIGVPAALPTSWNIVSGYFAGPGADLRGAQLAGADLSGANLTGAMLGARATLVSCAGMHPCWSMSPAADLSGANLSGANLSGADLSGGNAPGPCSSSCSAAGTNLANADLANADLTNANLTGAIVTGAQVDATQLAGATLTGVVSGSLTGTPASLPTGWTLVGGELVPPPS